MESKIISKGDIYTVLICGIPGVGKSFFSKILINYFENRNLSKENMFYETFYFSFDEIFFLTDINTSITNTENNINTDILSYDNQMKIILDLSKYKPKRKEFLEKYIEKAQEIINNRKIKNISNKIIKYVFIIDDNFYLKSMKKPFFKFCRNFQISYNEIHIKADLQYCLNLNSQRKGIQRIPDHVTQKVLNNFQWDSFNENFIYEIKISDLNSLHKVNLEDIYRKMLINFEVIQNLEMKISINSLENEKLKIEKKKNKTIFIETFENSLRNKVGEIIKMFIVSNDSKIRNKIDTKYISSIKQKFFKMVKNLLLNISEKEDTICFVDPFAFITLIEKIKEENYKLNNVNILIEIFCNLLNLIKN